MAIISENDKYLTYRYTVKKFMIDFGNGISKTLKTDQVKSLIVTNDYINATFPICQIKLSMSSTLYYKVLRHKNGVRFIMNIQKYYVEDKKSKKSLYDEYINQSFKLILDDDDEDLYAAVRKKNNGDNQTDEDLKEQAQEVEFYLFRSDLIKSTKKTINKIIQNSNVTNVITYILGKMGIDDMLMSKADNDKNYPVMIIPPMKNLDALKYIDNFYGIYKTGSILYFGINRSYLIKFDTSCTAYEKDEIRTTTIIVPQAGSSLAQNSCSVKKIGHENKNYIVADYETIQFGQPSISDTILNGDSVEIVDSSTGEIDGETGSSTKVIENCGENKFFKNIYRKIKNGLQTSIVVEFDDIDLDVLEPNKKFNFVFEDTSLSQKYKGTYFLGKSEIGLFRSTADLNTTVRCTFYSD